MGRDMPSRHRVQSRDPLKNSELLFCIMSAFSCLPVKASEVLELAEALKPHYRAGGACGVSGQPDQSLGDSSEAGGWSLGTQL